MSDCTSVPLQKLWGSWDASAGLATPAKSSGNFVSFWISRERPGGIPRAPQLSLSTCVLAAEGQHSHSRRPAPDYTDTDAPPD